MQEDIIDPITLERRAEIIYAFLDAYTAFRNVPKDYGTGENFTMTQIHLLDYIDKNPGSTITDNVPAGSLAIARERQTNKPGWADQRRKDGKLK